MTARHEATPEIGSTRTETSPGWRAMEWLLGIIGGIAAFLGLFILFAGDDQYVGIGGDLSWRVGDISSAWAYGLLIGGGVFLFLALGMVVFGVGASRGRPRTRGTDLSDLLWHTGIFVVVNGFIWLQDIAIGGGLEYAYWVTIPWAIGLASHALAYYFSRARDEALPEGMAQGQEARELQHH